MEQREITLHGRRFGYRCSGSGPLIVLLHGIARSSATWEDVAWHLRDRFTVLAPDLLGHGESCKRAGDYSLGSYANLLRDLLGALGHRSVTLVGHSLGGGVAMQFSYQYPERCERLVLVSSGGLGREVHPLLRSAALPGAEVVLPWLCGERTRSTVDRITGWLGRLGLRAGPDLQEAWDGFVSLGEADARRAFLDTVRGILDIGGQRVSATDRLYLASEIPTLLVWGDQDRLIPVSHAHAAHDRLPGSRLEVFAGSGHFPYRDDPRRFVEVLIDFLGATRPVRLRESNLRQRLRAEAGAAAHSLRRSGAGVAANTGRGDRTSLAARGAGAS